MFDVDALAFASADFMGRAVVPLSGYSAVTRPVDKWIALQKLKHHDEVSGEIHVRLDFSPLDLEVRPYCSARKATKNTVLFR